MAVVAWQGITTGADPRSPIGVPVGATTVNATNPNNFPVYVAMTNSVSAATITSVTVGTTVVGTVAGTYLVPAGGTIKCTYASGTTTYLTYGTGLPAANNYPFTDAVFQNFTAQQYLTVTGVVAAQTYSLEAPAEEAPVKAEEAKPEPKPEAKPEPAPVKNKE